jgi:hypothetical protein
MAPDAAALRLIKKMTEFFTPDSLGTFCNTADVVEKNIYDDLEKAIRRRGVKDIDTLAEELKYVTKIRSDICVRVSPKPKAIEIAGVR